MQSLDWVTSRKQPSASFRARQREFWIARTPVFRFQKTEKTKQEVRRA